ncbi:hypothetical protein TKWG_10475 [Advenella kashmirensis WT001]|uniref:Uncharacterized protein n=1 Tax=Advenella kashmirensis (strain DSM 17095 / LMG 22695 / WT001) TaxID=1036672 RepID=I3UBG9_ADVKW|nr:hypothetical protein [Advenella kashmirensis]AFK62357.1 hypothetical protein TKWG_10475 [Advenella kashmirensis WT001]
MKNANNTHDLYDVFQWNENVIDHHSDEITPDASWDQDGIHRIFVTDGNSIDLLLHNHVLLDECSPSQERILLVGFTGDMALRDKQKGPFFFGLDIAEQLRLPVLAVADPTISKSEDLNIAWYTGNENAPKAIEVIGTWLNKLARHYNARLVLFGGSAGSFGALSVLPYMTESTGCLVWNPQTSLAQCDKTFVISYLKNAFPTRNSELSINDEISQQDLAARLVREGIYYDLQRNYQIPSAVKLLFLENKTDVHVASHASPFLNNLGFAIDSKNLTNQRVNNVFAHFDVLDEGLDAPNQKTVTTCLKWLIDNSDVPLDLTDPKQQSDIPIGLTALAQQSDTPIDLVVASEQQSIDTAQEEEKFEVTATLDGSNLLASVHVVPGVFIKPFFAFYLFIDGQRTSIKPYSPENSTLFEISGRPNKIEVTGYVLDNGKRDSKRINVDLPAQ